MTVCFIGYIGPGAASLLTSTKSISNFPIQRLQKPLGKQSIIDVVRFVLVWTAKALTSVFEETKISVLEIGLITLTFHYLIQIVLL